MTAVNVIVQPDAVYIFTDAAACTSDGVIAGISSKTCVWPHLPACLAVRGSVRHKRVIETALIEHAASFDDMVREAPNLAVAAAHECAGSPHGIEFDMMLAGWSEARKAFEAYQLIWRGEPAPVQWTSARLGSLISPSDDNILAEMARTGVKPGGKLPPIREFGRIVMAAQRVIAAPTPHGVMGRSVGVHCQMITMRRDSILTEVIQRWPEDRVGRRIGETDGPRSALLPGLPVGRR